MRRQEEKSRTLRIALALLAVVLISMYLVSNFYARYAILGSGSDSAEAAAFVFTTEDTVGKFLDLSKISKPGDSATCTFTVSNSDGTSVSQTALVYSFEVQLNGSMPLECTITRAGASAADGGTTGSQVLSEKIAENTPSLPVISPKIIAGSLPAGEEKTDTYAITVTWPEDANDAKYASRSASAEVLLTVEAQQAE